MWSLSIFFFCFTFDTIVCERLRTTTKLEYSYPDQYGLHMVAHIYHLAEFANLTEYVEEAFTKMDIQVKTEETTDEHLKACETIRTKTSSVNKRLIIVIISRTPPEGGGLLELCNPFKNKILLTIVNHGKEWSAHLQYNLTDTIMPLGQLYNESDFSSDVLLDAMLMATIITNGPTPAGAVQYKTLGDKSESKTTPIALGVVGGSLFIVLVAGLFIYRQKKVKAEQAKRKTYIKVVHRADPTGDNQPIDWGAAKLDDDDRRDSRESGRSRAVKRRYVHDYLTSSSSSRESNM